VHREPTQTERGYDRSLTRLWIPAPRRRDKSQLAGRPEADILRRGSSICGLPTMAQMRSIRTSLTKVFLLFFSLILLLGLFSVGTLSYINGISSELRNRWLQSTRFLGDLNNYTSDFRAAEGATILASNAEEIMAGENEIKDLDHSIGLAEQRYQLISHDGAERDLYAQFETQWSGYRQIVDRVVALLRADHKDEAISLYRTSSRSAYNAASDTLGELTDRSVAKAEEASDRAADAYKDARFLILAAILFAAVIVAAAIKFIRRSLSGPLLDLADRMHRLAANEMDVEIRGTERSDEIGQMARAVVIFQKNAVELAVSQRTLSNQASILEEKLEQEQRLTQMQRNFVSMASHEFRTPLTIIDGHAQRLIATKDRLNADELAERARKIRGAVKRVTNVMGNLLESSRLLDGNAKLSLNYAEFDLTLLLQEVCLLHREIAPRSQICENFAAEPHWLVGDRSLLFQAFSNLLSNAIKYSPDGGLITIKLTSNTKQVIVSICDRGIGIPKEETDLLFERYYRGSNAQGTVGTGIGLYFVKMVVELHEGHISVESREGAGSQFTVRLPVSLAEGNALDLSLTLVPRANYAEPSCSPPR
jgi:two-component system OmpR family sensor kinase